MWDSGGGWMQEWSMIWEWLMEDFMMWMKTDPSDTQTGWFCCVAAALTTSLLGPEASPWHHCYNWCHVFFISFPGGFAAQSRIAIPQMVTSSAGTLCVWACLFALCLSIHTPFARQVKREVTIEFSHKDVGVLISDLGSAPQGCRSGRSV